MTPAIRPARELLLLLVVEDDEAEDVADRVPEDVSVAKACAAVVSVAKVPRSQVEDSLLNAVVLDPVCSDPAEEDEVVCSAVTVVESLDSSLEVLDEVIFGVRVVFGVGASSVVFAVNVVIGVAAAAAVVSSGVVAAAAAGVAVVVGSSSPPSLPPPPFPLPLLLPPAPFPLWPRPFPLPLPP